MASKPSDPATTTPLDWPVLEAACIFVVVATCLTIFEIGFAVLVAVPQVQSKIDYSLDKLSTKLRDDALKDKGSLQTSVTKDVLNESGRWFGVLKNAEARLRARTNQQVYVVGGVLVASLAVASAYLISTLHGNHKRHGTGRLRRVYAKIAWWVVLNLAVVIYFQKGFIHLGTKQWKFVDPDVTVRDVLRANPIERCDKLAMAGLGLDAAVDDPGGAPLRSLDPVRLGRRPRRGRRREGGVADAASNAASRLPDVTVPDLANAVAAATSSAPSA